jgi:DnaJ homolog subfamily A member 2
MYGQREDYYKALGLDRGASIHEVKTAYRKLARMYHHDSPVVKKALAACKSAKEKENLKSEMDEKFSKISAAHNVLSNEDTKRRYDNGEDLEDGMMGGAGGFADIFDGMFGGFGPGSQRPRKCKSEVKKVLITLEEVVTGKQCKYKIPKRAVCLKCNAIGSASSEKCSRCGGQGVYMEKTQMGGTILCRKATCSSCRGEGYIRRGPSCGDCGGSGYIQQSNIVEVKIPPGVMDGHKIVYEKMGDEEKDLLPGDVVFVVSIKPHPRFARLNGAHLYTETEVPLHKLLSGECTSVETLGGTVNVSLPKVAKIDLGEDLLTVSGQGLPVASGHGRGNLYVRIIVKFPPKVDLRKMREAFGVEEEECREEDAIGKFVSKKELERTVEEEHEREHGEEEPRETRRCTTV